MEKKEELALAKHNQNLLGDFVEYLKADIANGDAADDTLTVYFNQLYLFLLWCQENNFHPAEIDRNVIKDYRKYLIDQGMRSTTIKLKLIVVKRFFDCAVERNFIKVNPAKGVVAPRDRQARLKGIQNYLTEEEASLLFQSIPKQSPEKYDRARAIIGLMALEGLRTIEVHRMNIEDINFSRGEIYVHGKGHDDYIYPRDDTLDILEQHLSRQEKIPRDDQGTPAFVSLSNNKNGHRLSRTAIRDIVDGCLTAAGLKKPGLSCHCLRHTCGTLLYRATKDLRIVQETLRHQSPTVTSLYAHIIRKEEEKATEKIHLKL